LDFFEALLKSKAEKNIEELNALLASEMRNPIGILLKKMWYLLYLVVVQL